MPMPRDFTIILNDLIKEEVLDANDHGANLEWAKYNAEMSFAGSNISKMQLDSMTFVEEEENLDADAKRLYNHT